MKLKIDGTLSKLKSITNRLMDFEDDSEEMVHNSSEESVAAVHPFISVFIERKQMLGWTVADISQKTGIPITTILDVENGVQMPTWDLLEKYAKVLGLSITIIEEIPIEDLLDKQGTTEIIANLEVGQTAYGDCGKYIKKDPVTKAVLECTKDGEPLGVLSLTEEVMKSRWVILVDESKKQSTETEDPVSQTELEKEIFLNVIYSDLDNPQLYSYLLTVKNKITNEELFTLISVMCDKLQTVRELSSAEETELKDSSLQDLEKEIHELKEKILQYFFKGVGLHSSK